MRGRSCVWGQGQVSFYVPVWLHVTVLVTLVTLHAWSPVTGPPVTALVSVVQGIQQNHNTAGQLLQIHGECLNIKVGEWRELLTERELVLLILQQLCNAD